MSIFRAQPLLSFKFRTGMIYKIFNNELSQDDDIQEIIQSKYQDPYFQFNNSHENLLDTDNSIIQGLKEVEATQAVDKQVRSMASGIRSSILSYNAAKDLTNLQYDDRGEVSLKMSMSYKLPEKYVSVYRNIDPFSLDEKETVKITRQSRDIMAQQGAEYISYMYRLSGKYFRNEKDGQKIMNRTGISNESVGVYRVVLYVDLTQPQFSAYVKEIAKVYQNSGIEPFGTGGIQNYKQVPFYYLVVIHRPHDHKNEVTNIFVKFMEDLSQEYELYIKPMFSRVAYTNEHPFSPLNVPGDFWTLRYMDKGFGDLSAKISIRSYVDMFPTLDPDQLVELWDRDFHEPSFVFDDECALVGKSMIDTLRTSLSGFNSGNRSNTLRSVTDSTLRQIFSHSDIASCNMLSAKDCALPLAFWVREIFDHSAQMAQNLVTRSVVLFFVMSADRSIRSKMKEDADLIFSRESGKESFPADPYVAAVVFNIVIANCLSHYQNKVTWTADAFESHKHPNPWGALIEKANDVNGPRFAFPNYSGMRDVVQSLDLVLFSFIGGYISFCQDTQLATLWRKIRVGLLRMTYQDTPEDRQEFMKNANMHGFVEKLNDFKQGLQAIANENVRTRVETATYGAPNVSRKYMDNSGHATDSIRTLTDSEASFVESALEPMMTSPVTDHWGNGKKVLFQFAETLWKRFETTIKVNDSSDDYVEIKDPIAKIQNLIQACRQEPNYLDDQGLLGEFIEKRNEFFEKAPEPVFVELYNLLIDFSTTSIIRNLTKYTDMNAGEFRKTVSSSELERCDRLSISLSVIPGEEFESTLQLFSVVPIENDDKDRFARTKSSGLPLALCYIVLNHIENKNIDEFNNIFDEYDPQRKKGEEEGMLKRQHSRLEEVFKQINVVRTSLMKYQNEIRVAGWCLLEMYIKEKSDDKKKSDDVLWLDLFSCINSALSGNLTSIQKSYSMFQKIESKRASEFHIFA